MASSSRRLWAHLKAAYAYSELSSCKRLQVGAVLIKDDRIVSVGYNGTPSGGSNWCEDVINGELVTKSEVVHAEKNCIAFAAKFGVSTDGCSLVLTHSPCYECCTLIIQCGIKEVWYDQEYRDKRPIEFLQQFNVKVERIKDGTS